MNRRLALTVAGTALVAVLAACGSDHSGDDHAGTAGASSAGAAATAPTSSSTGARAADVLFAQSMIPHHAQAVEMADLALQKASRSEVKALAAQIKAAQDPEIATMRGWLKAWGAPEDMGMDHSGMDHMPGMMSDADLKALEAAGGSDFDTTWLRMMIAHHEGALTMAQQVLATSSDAEVKALAQAVIAGQTAEITTMRGLLGG